MLRSGGEDDKSVSNCKALPVLGNTAVSSTSITLGNMNRSNGNGVTNPASSSNSSGSTTSSLSSGSERYTSRYVPLSERTGMSALLGLDKDKDSKVMSGGGGGGHCRGGGSELMV